MHINNIILLAFIIVGVAGWFTHVIYCIQVEAYLFLIAGAICAPIGTIHGIGLWFGLF